jgi:hypothetical protein
MTLLALTAIALGIGANTAAAAAPRRHRRVHAM